MTKLELLSKYVDQANHNFFCYSRNYAMTEPKEGFERQWKQAKEECELLDVLMKEAVHEVQVLEQQLSQDALEMSTKEFATLIVEWANKNLICKAHAVMFFKIITRRITKERPWFGEIEVS